MTSSSFSSNAFFALLFWSVTAWSASPPVRVEIPTRAFSKKEFPSTHAELWLARNRTSAADMRGVVLVAPPDVDSLRWQSTAEFISEAGFDVVTLEPRKNEKQYQRALLEDIQSGVLFMKTDPRVHASSVIVIGSEAAANVAAHYAAASDQMSLVLGVRGAIVLINPDKQLNAVTLSATLKKIKHIPVLLLTAKSGIVDRTKVLRFLQRPHG